MAENIKSNFKRKEKKYLLDTDRYDKVLAAVQSNMDRNKYFKSTVCNVYYDTDAYRLINRSIEKPLYKEKLRIRTYLTDNWNEYTFAEMKKKYNGIVYKRRVGADYQCILKFLRTAKEESAEAACSNFFGSGLSCNFGGSSARSKFSYSDRQISKEIAWMTQRYALEPKLWIGYERISYTGRAGIDLRITFDEDIVYRDDNLDLSVYGGEKLFDFPYHLMEIKTGQGAPAWLCSLLSENNIYPFSFSKCGRIYKDKIFSNYLTEE